MFTKMESFSKLLVAASIVPAFIYLFLSMYVLHNYEARTNKKPPTVQWWSFDKAISKEFPEQAKLARKLEIAVIVMALPWLVLTVVG